MNRIIRPTEQHELLSAWAETNANPALTLRVAGAALGLSGAVDAVSPKLYRGDVMEFGAVCADALLAAMTPVEIIRSGGKVLSEVMARLYPTKAEVQDKADFLGVSGEASSGKA